MPFSFELHFDAQAEAAIRRLWTNLHAAGFCDASRNGTAPHITLAIAEELPDGDGIAQRLTTFLRTEKPFALTLESLDVFPSAGVIYLAPRMTPELLGIHNRFHAQFDLPAAVNSHYYTRGNWTPHCTVATAVPADKLDQAIAKCQDFPLPQRATVEQLVVVWWPQVIEQFRRDLATD